MLKSAVKRMRERKMTEFSNFVNVNYEKSAAEERGQETPFVCLWNVERWFATLTLNVQLCK